MHDSPSIFSWKLSRISAQAICKRKKEREQGGTAVIFDKFESAAGGIKRAAAFYTNTTVLPPGPATDPLRFGSSQEAERAQIHKAGCE